MKSLFKVAALLTAIAIPLHANAGSEYDKACNAIVEINSIDLELPKSLKNIMHNSCVSGANAAMAGVSAVDFNIIMNDGASKFERNIVMNGVKAEYAEIYSASILKSALDGYNHAKDNQ